MAPAQGAARPTTAAGHIRRAPTFTAGCVSHYNRKLTQVAAVNTNAIPSHYVQYETILMLIPTVSDAERDQQLSRCEVLLGQEKAIDLRCSIRGRQRLAYPINGHEEGILVLYTYSASLATCQKLQKLLSTPEAGSSHYLLRHLTFKL